jgi:hypothetical protein
LNALHGKWRRRLARLFAEQGAESERDFQSLTLAMRRYRPVFALLFSVLCAADASQTETRQTGTASITGSVTAYASDEPITEAPGSGNERSITPPLILRIRPRVCGSDALDREYGSESRWRG